MNDLVTCNILNIELYATTVDDTVVLLREGITSGKYSGSYICNTSVQDIMEARNDEAYINALASSLFNLPNSSQLVVEMHTQGYPLAKRIVVLDFMSKLINACKDSKIYFVCADKATAESIELSVKEYIPDSNLCGAGVYNEENTICEINEITPDIIFVGIGGKDEAIWLHENASKFKGLSIGVRYGLSSFINGRVWNDTRRFGFSYILMNIKYLCLTGKKFLWTTLSWTPAFITIMIILILTLQTGEVSKTNSGKLAEKVTYSTFWGFDFSRFANSSAGLEDLNSIIRFWAHIGEYAFLTICIGFAITANGIRKKLRFIYMCLLGFFVACCDEFVQIFVPNRYCDFYDLMCDSLGIIVIAFITFILGRRYYQKSEFTYSSESRRRKFLNISIDDISFNDATDRIIQMAKTEGKKYVVTPNVDHVIKNEKDLLFRKIYEKADLIITDGTPLMWIAESLGCPIKEKIPGSDMLPRVCERAAQEGLSMFFLGAAEGVAEEAARRLKEKYVDLNVVGCYSPPLGFEKNKSELEKTVEAINVCKADILVVSLGCPKQEKFIYNNLDKIDFNVALPFGAALDFEAGNITRAPEWMRKSGLEWFYRFLQEPGRLFKRYFIDDVKIFWLAWKYRNEIMRIR